MKLQILLFFFLISFSFSTAQKEYKIITTDGTIYKTKKISKKNDMVKFKAGKAKKEISYSKLEKIVASGNKEKHNFIERYITYVVNEKNNKIDGAIMRELVVGKVSLYARTDMIVTGSGPYGPTMSSVSTYFTKRKGEKNAFQISAKKIFESFKKEASYFFSHCSMLVEKIDSRQFKKKDIVEIVQFYNSNCQ